jgi:hypothetical protein
MERRINKTIEEYISTFKDNIREHAEHLGLTKDAGGNQLLQFIYDYERLNLTKEDFMKRKRVKNAVHLNDRCIAKRANEQQCTRRKKEGCMYCGTHIKGTPHGICTLDENETASSEHKVEVWPQEIKGIVYYIDKNMNVYQTEDIISNKTNPKVIAKYTKNGETYSIPAFSL